MHITVDVMMNVEKMMKQSLSMTIPANLHSNESEEYVNLLNHKTLGRLACNDITNLIFSSHPVGEESYLSKY